jgi:CspA family cold shock protein
MDKSTGTVKWFSRVRGYGFIQPDDGSEDVFVHFSAIEGDGYRNLYEEERVRFRMEDSPKGPQAIEVTRIVTDEGDEGEGEAQEPAASWPDDVEVEVDVVEEPLSEDVGEEH